MRTQGRRVMLDQFRLFADYNQMMNRRLFNCAVRLPHERLCEDRGAFFQSILGTFNHLLVGDIIWLKRFAAHPSSSQALAYIASLPAPKSLDAILHQDLGSLAKERYKIDAIIIQWVRGLTEQDLNETIAYTNMAGVQFRKSFASLISHLFLHQAHHRGQVTTLLSQFGLHFGETDIIELIEEESAL